MYPISAVFQSEEASLPECRLRIAPTHSEQGSGPWHPQLDLDHQLQSENRSVPGAQSDPHVAAQKPDVCGSVGFQTPAERIGNANACSSIQLVADAQVSVAYQSRLPAYPNC